MALASKMSWQPLAEAQKNTPHTDALAQRFSEEIGRRMTQFGPKVVSRVYPSVYFGITTFPLALRERYAYNQGYLISWVFALDELLDTCPSFDYAADLQLLLASQLGARPDAGSNYFKLPQADNLQKKVPGLGYSVFDVAQAIQPLRRRLYQAAPDGVGPAMFDRYLTNMIVPAMQREAAWRLGKLPQPGFEEYVATATTSICGGLCVATLNAILTYPTANWQVVERATNTMCRAVRLVNEIATQSKDAREGKPNAVTLLANEVGSLVEAEHKVRQMIDTAAGELEDMCGPLMRLDAEDPLYALGYYIYYSWVITEAMYSDGDFIAPAGK